MNARDREIMKELGHESLSAYCTTAVFALLFGAAAGLACFSTHSLLIELLTVLVFSSDLLATQYNGLMYIVRLGSAFVVIVAWVSLLLAVWGMLSKRHEIREKVKLGGIWTAGAAAVWIVTVVIGKLI